MNTLHDDDALPGLPRLLDDGELGVELDHDLAFADDESVSLDDGTLGDDASMVDFTFVEEGISMLGDDATLDLDFDHDGGAGGPEYGFLDDGVANLDFDADFAPVAEAHTVTDSGEVGLDEPFLFGGADDDSHLPPLATDTGDGEGPAEPLAAADASDEFDPRLRRD